MPLLQDRPYTFAEIFKLNAEPDILLAEYGYQFEQRLLRLPCTTSKLDRLAETRSRIESVLPYISLTSEAARREMLIAPVLADIVHYTRARLRIEFPLKVNDKLQGNLDYLLEGVSTFLVIEAKQEDMDNGFNQLAVELIALDSWDRSASANQQPVFTGVVSTGRVWQFGLLDRQSQTIVQGLENYRVPEDLEQLQRILVARF